MLTHDALRTLINARRRQDGISPQVILPGQYLLTHGQDAASRATTLRLLRQGRQPTQAPRRQGGEA
jgi:hypothetical protein